MTAKVQLSPKKAETLAADVLVVPVTAGELEDNALLARIDEAVAGGLLEHLAKVRFQPHEGSVVRVPTLGRGECDHVLLAGVRPSESDQGLIEAVAQAVRESLELKASRVVVALPEGASVRALSQASRLGAYVFHQYMTDEKRTQPALELVTIAKGAAISAADRSQLALGLRLADGVCLARDLVNEPPNILYPEEFAKRAKQVAKRRGLTCKVLDQKGIQKAGMHLHDAVGKGSDQQPYFIHLTYKPEKPKGKVAFVGKGITFDSGGLCIKPAGGMLTMKSDMAGAAAVLGLMEAVSALDVQVEVHGIIGAAENMPDGKAYRPSDVITSLSGKGVEIINTDAEGRLVLADALTYAARLDPDFIVDAATLTGATVVSLGNPYSAFFTGSDEIASAMELAAKAAGESFWRMPLIEELRQQLMSDVTDLKHTGDRMGGAITAALFLREFTADVPWMHCDVPGPTFRDRASGMHPKGGTGHAVLTFLQLVAQHGKEPIVSQAPAESKSGRGRAGPGRASKGRATKRTVTPAAKRPAATPRRRKKPRS